MPRHYPPKFERNTRKLTSERKAKFLQAIIDTGGSVSAAAAIASPHSKGGAVSTFEDAIKRDPVFAAEVRDALKRAEGKLEAEINRRAHVPTTTKRYKDGELVEETQNWQSANQLLLALARARMPRTWAEKQQLSVEGKVEHTLAPQESGTFIKLDHVLMLPDKLQAQAFRVLEALAEIEAQEAAQAKVPAQPTPMLDVTPKLPPVLTTDG